MTLLKNLFILGLVLAAASFVFTVGLYIIGFIIAICAAAFGWIVGKVRKK